MKVLASESKEKHFDDHDEVKALGSAEKHCDGDHDEVKVFASESAEKHCDNEVMVSALENGIKKL